VVLIPPILSWTEVGPDEQFILASSTSSDHVDPAVKYQLELNHLIVGIKKIRSAATEIAIN
jgi:hypothetical protein